MSRLTEYHDDFMNIMNTQKSLRLCKYHEYTKIITTIWISWLHKNHYDYVNIMTTWKSWKNDYRDCINIMITGVSWLHTNINISYKVNKVHEYT